MHELKTFEAAALEAYAGYNFPKGTLSGPSFMDHQANGRDIVISLTSNFANVTLSTLYFDITKDYLYANAKDSLERRAILTVLEKVRAAFPSLDGFNADCFIQTLSTMTRTLAPILPHLAEEIHQCRSGDDNSTSVFMTSWIPLVS